MDLLKGIGIGIALSTLGIIGMQVSRNKLKRELNELIVNANVYIGMYAKAIKRIQWTAFDEESDMDDVIDVVATEVAFIAQTEDDVEDMHYYPTLQKMQFHPSTFHE